MDIFRPRSILENGSSLQDLETDITDQFSSILGGKGKERFKSFRPLFVNKRNIETNLN